MSVGVHDARRRDHGAALVLYRPNTVFNPMVSFQVVIMALLGGMHRLWGPVLGVVPMIMLSEFLQVRAPFWYSVLLGAVFLVIVYFLPHGVDRAHRTPGIGSPADRAAARRDRAGSTSGLLSQPIALPRGIAGLVEDGWARVTKRLTPEGR